MPPDRFYEIVESRRFRAQMGELADVERWDDVMRGVMWALARDPFEAGQPTSVPFIHGLPTEAAPGVPAVVIYYSVMGWQVELLGLRLAAAGNGT